MSNLPCARVALVGAVSALLTVLLAATAPSAAAAPGGCPANAFCLYSGTSYGGDGAFFAQPGTRGNPAHTYNACYFNQLAYPSRRPLDNTARSMVNNTRFYVVLYQLDGCGGTTYVARPHSVDTTFGNNSFDKKASGLVFVDDRT